MSLAVAVLALLCAASAHAGVVIVTGLGGTCPAPTIDSLAHDVPGIGNALMFFMHTERCILLDKRADPATNIFSRFSCDSQNQVVQKFYYNDPLCLASNVAVSLTFGAVDLATRCLTATINGSSNFAFVDCSAPSAIPSPAVADRAVLIGGISDLINETATSAPCPSSNGSSTMGGAASVAASSMLSILVLPLAIPCNTSQKSLHFRASFQVNASSIGANASSSGGHLTKCSPAPEEVIAMSTAPACDLIAFNLTVPVQLPYQIVNANPVPVPVPVVTDDSVSSIAVYLVGGIALLLLLMVCLYFWRGELVARFKQCCSKSRFRAISVSVSSVSEEDDSEEAPNTAAAPSLCTTMCCPQRSNQHSSSGGSDEDDVDICTLMFCPPAKSSRQPSSSSRAPIMAHREIPMQTMSRGLSAYEAVPQVHK